jgi:hypothetical protein
MERQADPAAPPQPCKGPLGAGATHVPGNGQIRRGVLKAPPKG